jgi:hypothetical protein
VIFGSTNEQIIALLSCCKCSQVVPFYFLPTTIIKSDISPFTVIKLLRKQNPQQHRGKLPDYHKYRRVEQDTVHMISNGVYDPSTPIIALFFSDCTLTSSSSKQSPLHLSKQQRDNRSVFALLIGRQDLGERVRPTLPIGGVSDLF